MNEQFAVSLAQWENFQFLVDFNQDGVADLLTDEPEPVGAGKGPDPARLLAAAVGNCLGSSLMFCLRKSQIDVKAMKVVVEGKMERNNEGRLRIRSMRVKVEPALMPEDAERIGDCAQLFEDFCIVTQSLKDGIDVAAEVAVSSPDRSII